MHEKTLTQANGLLLLTFNRCEPKQLNKVTFQGELSSTRLYLDDTNLIAVRDAITEYLNERGL